MKRYVRLPFQATALTLVISFTLGLLLALEAGLMGIALAAILTSWFFKYCYILLDSVVAGNEEPPVLSAEMVNPVSEQRPVAQALLIIVGATLVGAVRKFVGQPAGMLVGATLVLALPASIAVLGVTGNPFRAAWPPALWGLVRGLGRDYLLLNAVTLASGGVIYWLGQYGAPAWICIAVTQMVFLLTFALVGGAVYEHRLELGVDSRSRQERESERDLREHARERSRMIDRAYAKFRVSKPLEGWQEIEAWLTVQARGEARIPEYRAVLEAASRWDDVRPADRLANDLIVMLLAKRETGAALEVTERRLASNPQFRPAQAAHALRLAELAALAGKRALRRQLESKD
jgi:hypothetical protein